MAAIDLHTKTTDPNRIIDRWPRMKHVGTYLFGVLLLVALLLYGSTLDNGLQPEELRGGDLITHQYAQVQARPSNAPGYPLYTMGGWLWFHLLRGLLQSVGVAIPNPIPILSSYSTLWALAALWLLYRILVRLFTRIDAIPHPPFAQPAQRLYLISFGPFGAQWLAALLTLFYATTYFFWYYATTTEQYSSAIAQTLAIVYVYLCWRDAEYIARKDTKSHGRAPEFANSPHREQPAIYWLLFLAFLCGLTLAHMLTVAFIVPPLILLVLWDAPHLLRRWRIVLFTVITALTPLVSYLYVYLRGAAHPEWWGTGEWSSASQWFWSFISTSQGREELGWGFEPWCTPFANGFPLLIGQELTWPILVLGLIGFALAGRRLALLFWGTVLIYLAFSWAYRCGNWFQVILPLYPLVVIGCGLFVRRFFYFVLQQFANRSAIKASVLSCAYLALAPLLLLVIAMRVVVVWPAVDSWNRSGDNAFDRAAELLARPLPSNQALFAALDETLALQYLIDIWEIQPEHRVVSSQEAAQRLASGEAIYSTWEMAPTLRAELPPTMETGQLVVDPNWVRFTAERQLSATESQDGAAVEQWHVGMLSNKTTVIGQQENAQSVLPTVILHSYYAMDTPQLSLAQAWPVAQARDTDRGIDLLLLWDVAQEEWPEGLAISVRLAAGGTMLDDAQLDRAAPALGLNENVGTLLPDPYHFTLTEQAATTVDGAILILYRTTGAGFENVAVLPLPWHN